MNSGTSFPALPLAERYERFRDSFFGDLQESSALRGFEQPMNELDVQSLWFAGAFGSEFTSLDGQPVRILDFGTWNACAGPDFTGCAVSVEGQTLRGDIELDPDARDWERHQHGANADYAHVVLHLFLHAPEERFFTRSSEHRQIVQVHLNPAMVEIGARPNRDLAAARIGRCAAPLRDMPAARVLSMIEAAAQHRLARKSARLARSVAAQGPEQALYQALAQTLGYRNNQQPFTILSQRLPLRRLLKCSPLQREALLYGVSTFLESVRYEDTLPDTRAYLRSLWDEWWQVRDACQHWLTERQLLRWRLVGARPGNHPHRRLGALGALLGNWSAVSAPLLESTRWSQAAWRETLLALTHDHWSTHYTLLSAPAKRPSTLIGESRVHEMLANVAYPLLMPQRTRLWAEYLELPALQDNQKVRRAVLRLFGAGAHAVPYQTKLHQHQGLLQIYEDFCLEDDSACAGCPFPERLKEWS